MSLKLLHSWRVFQGS